MWKLRDRTNIKEDKRVGLPSTVTGDNTNASITATLLNENRMETGNLETSSHRIFTQGASQTKGGSAVGTALPVRRVKSNTLGNCAQISYSL